MARFFTKHEMAKFDKKLTEENFLDPNKYKQELKNAISNENHRTNVDSAKKKAVIQGMNYDGFHQMVLGADLKGLKQGEFTSISNNNSILNNTNTQKKFTSEVDILTNAFVVDGKKKDIEIKDELINLRLDEQPNKLDQNHFIKEWKLISIKNNKEDILISQDINNDNIILENAQIYIKATSFEKYHLLKKFETLEFLTLLDEKKIPSDIFLDMLNLFGEILLSYLKIKDTNGILVIFNYLKIFTESKYYSSLKIFIGKKQKAIFSELKSELNKKDNKYLFTINEIEKQTKTESDSKDEKIITFIDEFLK